MKEENRRRLWKIIVDADDYLRCWPDTLVHSSYADNLKLIKNNSHKDSLKTPIKLQTNYKQKR